jgi:hypothetical protein
MHIKVYGGKKMMAKVTTVPMALLILDHTHNADRITINDRVVWNVNKDGRRSAHHLVGWRIDRRAKIDARWRAHHAAAASAVASA